MAQMTDFIGVRKTYDELSSLDVLVRRTLYEDGVRGETYYRLQGKKNDKSAWVYVCDEDGNILPDYIYSGFDRVEVAQKPILMRRNEIPRLVVKTLTHG